MGLASYYRLFVKDLASIAPNLIRLTQKDVLFECTNKCEEIFKKFKTFFTITLILTLSMKGKSFTIYHDASCMGLGVVMM